jgi:hypothetical protein
VKAFFYANRFRLEAETIEDLEPIAQLSGRNTLAKSIFPPCDRVYTTRNPEGNALGDQYHTGGPAQVVFAAEWRNVNPAAGAPTLGHRSTAGLFDRAAAAEEGASPFAQGALAAGSAGPAFQAAQAGTARRPAPATAHQSAWKNPSHASFSFEGADAGTYSAHPSCTNLFTKD